MSFLSSRNETDLKIKCGEFFFMLPTNFLTFALQPRFWRHLFEELASAAVAAAATMTDAVAATANFLAFCKATNGHKKAKKRQSLS